jgi:hypothetical protein
MEEYRDCFREPIPEFDEAVRLLDAAAAAHVAGDVRLAASLIAEADMPEIRDWLESLWGKQSPYLQFREIPDAPPVIPKKDRLDLRMPNAAEKRALIERDGYHCRFCGLPVIRPEIRKLLHKAYPDALPWGRANDSQHAAFQAMWLQYDHIVPHARGGNNDLENLVITCAGCNFCRMNYLLEEVGINDPFDHEPIESNWDGLERVMVYR